MRYLLVTWDGAGNLPPELALCQRLIEDGHEVHVVADESCHDRIRAIGVEPVASSVAPAPEGLYGLDEMFDTFSRVAFGRSYAGDVVEHAGRVEPDRLLVDGMLFAGLAGAESTGLPTAALWHSLFVTMIESPLAELLQQQFFEGASALRADLGLEPVAHIADQLHRPDWLLAFTYPSIDQSPGSSWPNLHYVGAPVPEPGPAADLKLPPGDDPLAVVGFSTSDMGQVPVLQKVVDALADLPLRLLVTCGPAVDPSSLSVPGNARCIDFVPHDQVLPDADLLVTHVGHGTLAAGVRHGVPVLAVPMGRDQPANAMVVEHLGIGVAVQPDADAEAFAGAARRILDDDDIRKRSHELSQQVADDPDLDTAVELVTGTVPG